MNIHKDIKQQLMYFINKKDIPHIIFYGKSGCGKSEILSFFIKEIYKNVPNQHDFIMYINCAHGKGIKFIIDELKFFAKTNIQKNNLLFKSVILLNADSLTIDAQCDNTESVPSSLCTLSLMAGSILVSVCHYMCDNGYSC